MRSGVKHVPLYKNVVLQKKKKNPKQKQLKEISKLFTFHFLRLKTPRREETADDILRSRGKKRCKLITETSFKTREWRKKRRKVKVKHFLKLQLPFYLSFLKSLPPPCRHHHYHLYPPPFSLLLILSLFTLFELRRVK